MSWWQKKHEDRTDAETQLAQMAYCEVFFESIQGRRVLFDMQRHVHEIQSNNPEAQLILQEFVDSIPYQAGVRDLMAVINAKAEIARRFIEEPGGKDESLEEGYTE